MSRRDSAIFLTQIFETQLASFKPWANHQT